MVILEAIGITKTLGYRRVLASVSLRVARGERVVLLGENGSGKSTLLQLAARVIEPDQGRLSVACSLGFAPEKPDLPDHLLVGEWLDLVASLKGLQRAGELAFGVGELRGTRTSALSLGQRQRVSLAGAWLGDPELLLLDEPTNGLDRETQAELTARLASSTALIATHDRALGRAVGTRAFSLRGGELSALELTSIDLDARRAESDLLGARAPLDDRR
ncbi:MAG TPA: ABC transporter ATP-binding protein [Polyangiaceae bacterium]|nr:ABC transporter ATP-binding protein [Polyangiaceae bacterium]